MPALAPPGAEAHVRAMAAPLIRLLPETTANGIASG
jgi:hypothetical protein